jgi:hypothetical protein
MQHEDKERLEMPQVSGVISEQVIAAEAMGRLDPSTRKWCHDSRPLKKDQLHEMDRLVLQRMSTHALTRDEPDTKPKPTAPTLTPSLSVLTPSTVCEESTSEKRPIRTGAAPQVTPTTAICITRGVLSSLQDHRDKTDGLARQQSITQEIALSQQRDSTRVSTANNW